VEIVGISSDDESDGVAKFAEELGTSFGVGWDEGHVLAKRWGVNTMPTSFIIDATGTVRHVHAGFHDEDDKKIESEVTRLLEKGGSAPPAQAKTKDEPSKETAEAPTPPPADSAAPATSDPPATPAPAKPKKKKKKKVQAAH
jgi:hypothetical protein